jgi:hypothetical protein
MSGDCLFERPSPTAALGYGSSDVEHKDAILQQMVIGERFAWAHQPKTGGNATLAMFEFFPDLIVFADPPTAQAKHSSFAEREELVKGKILSCNIRRLPSYFLSVAIWTSRPQSSGGKPMRSPAEIAAMSRADLRLETITDGGRFQVDRWLRMEELAGDFLRFVSELTSVTDEQRNQILNLPRMNALEYDHDIASWFSDHQIEMMYETNPAWRALEEKVYGDLPI